MEWFCFWKGKRDLDFISLVAVGGDSCFVCQTFLISSEVRISNIAVFFFLRPLLFSLHFKYFQPKGYVWERKTYEIFSPILVVFQMRSVCAAVKKDVALM